MDIHTLDLGFRNLPGAAAAFLVIGGDEHLLVECLRWRLCAGRACAR